MTTTKLIYRLSTLITLIVALSISWTPTAAQSLDPDPAYKDRIHLKNGDVITGNMKELDRGKLRFKTRTMDEVFINWVDIEAIESNKYLRIGRADGRFHNGVIQASDLEHGLVVTDHDSEVEIPILTVSTIQPIRVDESFWNRIEGEAKVGVNFQTATDLLLINLSSQLRFREEKYELGFSANWNETTRNEDNTSSRADVSGTYTRFLRNRWFWKGSGGIERNEELGLDARAIVAATAGRYLIQNPTFRLELNGGIAGNWENRQDGTTLSAEGLVRSSLEIFKHTLPVTRLSANVNVFPGITESGRLRINTDVTLRNEIVRSVFWDLTFFSNYDNRPPEGASEEDYGIITSLGASF